MIAIRRGSDAQASAVFERSRCFAVLQTYSPSFSKVCSGKNKRCGREGSESIALAEDADALVLGINDDGVDANRVARTDNPADRIKQQGLAAPASLAVMIDG